MDVEEFRKRVNIRLPIVKIKKETRKLIQEKLNEKQGMISEMKDVYNPLIVNPLKNTIDENQDELIEQLHNEQKDIKLAITQGKSFEFDIGALFNEFDRETMKKYNLKEPYSFFSSSKEELLETRNRLNELSNKIGQEKKRLLIEQNKIKNTKGKGMKKIYKNTNTIKM